MMTDSRVINLNVSRAERDVFKTPSIEKLLEALIHSLSDARNVTVVSGVSGSGKSTLIDCLCLQAQSDWNICRIHARHTIGEKHILAYLNACFHSPGDLDTGRLAASLAQADMPRPVIVVDDADRLTTFALDLLFKIKQAVENHGGQIGIVLFSQPTISHLLAGPSLQRYNAMVRTIDLPTLTVEQSGAYIDHWLELRGYRDALQLSPAQRQTLHKRSGGLPGRLNGLLEQLVDKQGQAAESPGSNSGNLPVVSGVVATSIAIGIAIAVVFWSLTDEHDDNVTVAPVAMLPQSTIQADKAVPQDNNEVPATATGHTVVQDAAPPDKQQTKVIAKVPQHESDKTVSAPATHPGQPQPVPTPGGTDTRNVDSAAKPVPTLPKTSAPMPAKAEQLPAEPAPTTATIALQPTIPTVNEAAQETTLTAAEQTDDTSSVERSRPDSATLKQNGQAWLLAQSGQDYTVQLAASLDSHAIERFIKSQPDLPELHYVHIKQRNRDWYISLYGSYSSLALAKTAVDRLPASMRKNSPWIRRVEKLQSLVPVAETAAGKDDNADETKPESAGPAATVPDAGADTPSATDAVSVDDASAAAPAVGSTTSPDKLAPQSPGDGDTDLVIPPVLE